MSTTIRLIRSAKDEVVGWSGLKKALAVISLSAFICGSFLFLTPAGMDIRTFLAETVITTQHRSWAWIFVGAEMRDKMIRTMQEQIEAAAKDKQDLNMIHLNNHRTTDQLVKVQDISGKLWKGKMMFIYDPATIRVVVPGKQGEGERISSMVERTHAVAGINAGGFVDPDGLGNGFAPIGIIMSDFKVLYNDHDINSPQHVVGFTDEGKLVIGKYSLAQLRDLHVKEAVSFYPRVISNGKPLITSGDGGWGRAPRTAVGQTADGTVIFIVIDGRQTSSVGATLREVQDLLLQQGAVNAGFLDGGASSVMVKDNEVITSPASQYGERRLPSGFLVFDKPDDVQVDNIWEGLSEIDPGGKYDHPGYLQEQANKKLQSNVNRDS